MDFSKVNKRAGDYTATKLAGQVQYPASQLMNSKWKGNEDNFSKGTIFRQSSEATKNIWERGQIQKPSAPNDEFETSREPPGFFWSSKNPENQKTVSPYATPTPKGAISHPAICTERSSRDSPTFGEVRKTTGLMNSKSKVNEDNGSKGTIFRQTSEATKNIWERGQLQKPSPPNAEFETAREAPRFFWSSKNPENQKTVSPYATPTAKGAISHPAICTERPSKDSPTFGEIRKTTGLSGAGTKWYLRFLKEGLSAEDALRRVKERATQHAPEAKKRSATDITPPEAPLIKKFRASETTTTNPTPTKLPMSSSGREANVIRLAVLPKDFPDKSLTRDEQGNIEELLIEEMSKGWKTKLKFDGIHFRPGLVLIDCSNDDVAEWVSTTIPNLPGWEGIEITTCKGDNIPAAHMVTVYLPKAEGANIEKILKLLIAQNEDLHTDLWRVFSTKDYKNGKLLTIGVDDRSLEAIIANGNKLSYRFGHIPVHVHKKKRRPPPNKVTNENNTPSEESIPAEMEEEFIKSEKEVEVNLLPEEAAHLKSFEVSILKGASEDELPLLENERILTEERE